MAKVTDVCGFWCISSGSVLLEDLSNNVVEVSVYNTDETQFSQNFHLGRELCIIEPFYKIRDDCTAAIRVDKPKKEILDFPWPETTDAWKDLGNEFIKVCADGALLCYSKALVCDTSIDDTDSVVGGARKNKKQQRKAAPGKTCSQKVGKKAEICKLLTNISSVEFNLGNFESSFYFSVLALGTGLNRFKALFRLMISLKALKFEEVTSFAAWCWRGSSQFCSGFSEKEKATIVKEFGPFDSTHKLSSDTVFWADKRALLWMQKAQSNLGERTPHNGGGWLSYKESGNKLFVSGENAQAKEHYIAAILECPYFSETLHKSSFVMSNMAAAWLNKIQAKECISSQNIAKTLVGDSGFINDESSDHKPLGDILAEGRMVSCFAVFLNYGGNGRGWSRWAKFLENQGFISLLYYIHSQHDLIMIKN